MHSEKSSKWCLYIASILGTHFCESVPGARVAAGAQQTATTAAESARVADEVAHSVAVLEDAASRFSVAGSASRDGKER